MARLLNELQLADGRHDPRARHCRLLDLENQMKPYNLKYNVIRRWLLDSFRYRGYHVSFDQFTSKDDGCVMARVVIDGATYPFAHRSIEAASEAAQRIIDRLESAK